MNSHWIRSVFAAVLAVFAPTFAMAQGADPAPASKAQALIEQATKDSKYTFLMFYKTTDAASNAMSATLKEALAEKSEQAVVAYVQVGNPAEQELVTKYDVSRAPMPMTIAVAPNGAMTGMFAQRVTAEKLGDAFVTPTMMFTMKNLQENNLVLVTVQGSAKAAAPLAPGEWLERRG